LGELPYDKISFERNRSARRKGTLVAYAEMLAGMSNRNELWKEDKNTV